jgi:hypothetical protein
MTLTHDDANARLLDLVYGEAPPAERQALEAHVAGCTRCQRDLAALGHTRAQVRAALLDDQPVPSAARARLLKAAAEAAAPAAPVAPVRAAVPTNGPSLWERLRARWTFPTLATVGAVALMLLASKVFLNPEQTLERGHEGILPKEPVPSAQGTAAAPAALQERRAPATPPAGAASEPALPRDQNAAPAELDRQEEARRLRSRSHGAASPVAKAAADRVRAFAHDVGGDDGLGVIGEGRAVGGGIGSVGSVGGGATGSANRGAGAARHDQPEEKALAAKPQARAESKAEAESEESPVKGGAYASPPSGWKAGRVAAGSAAAPPPPVTAAAPAAAPAPVAAARPAPSAPKREMANDMLDVAPTRKSRVADEESAVAKSDSAGPARVAKKAKRDVSDSPLVAPSLDTLAKRAEQFFAARRWQEAIAAYRELLRRFPDADPATRWRTRLVQAQREASANTAPAAASAPAEAH